MTGRHSDVCSQAPGKQFQIVNRTKKKNRPEKAESKVVLLNDGWSFGCVFNPCAVKGLPGGSGTLIYWSPSGITITVGAPTAIEHLFPFRKPSPETVDSITSRLYVWRKGGQTGVRSQTM